MGELDWASRHCSSEPGSGKGSAARPSNQAGHAPLAAAQAGSKPLGALCMLLTSVTAKPAVPGGLLPEVAKAGRLL